MPHNANLVVNADSEQVLIANNNNGLLTYDAGSLENETINKRICKILEGGKTHLKSVGINTKRLSRNAQQKVSREAGWTLKSSAASVLATVSCTSAILNGEQLPRNPLRQIHQKVQELFNQKYLPRKRYFYFLLFFSFYR